MGPAGDLPGDNAARDGADDDAAAFSALLEDSAEDLYENAPCGYLSTLLDGRIAKVNTTLLNWLGYQRGDLIGRKHFSDLLTIGGRLYHETHFSPLLRMRGEISGIALEMKTIDGSRLPVLVTSTVKAGSDGQPLLIRTTVFDARERRAYEEELLRARRESERERQRLRELATTLQTTLLPPVLADVPGLDVAAHYHVASIEEVGGDFYDLFPLAAGTWGLFLGDVCGKGVAAAAVTSLTRYTLRAAAVYDPDPVAVLSNLNTVLCQEDRGPEPRYCTVIFGVLSPDRVPETFQITLSSGGHPPALLLRADGTAEYVPTPGGQLIGVLPDAHIAATTVHLRPGDTLVFYTDGLTEAHTEGEDRYGEEALLDFAAGLAPASAHRAITALRQLLTDLGSGVEDDTAVLAIGVPVRGCGDDASAWPGAES